MKLYFFSLNRVRTKKKSLHRELKDIFPLNWVKTKKTRSFPQFGTIFGRNYWDLLVLTGTFLSDHPALKSRRGDVDSRWGRRPPYNLNIGEPYF